MLIKVPYLDKSEEFFKSNSLSPNLTNCHDSEVFEVETKVAKKYFNVSQYFWFNKLNLPHSIQSYFFLNSLLITDPFYDSDQELIFFCDGIEHRDSNRRTSIKPGKFFKKIGPWLIDWQVELIVNKLRKVFEKPDVEIKVGSSRSDFNYAYVNKNYCKKEIYHSFKSLNASCMRYEFSNLPCHPSEVYASGDFEIWYTVDKEGLVYSRVVVSAIDKIYSNIYAVSDYTGNVLLEKLQQGGYEESENFDNHRMLKIPYENYFVAPYTDFCQSATDDGDFFVMNEYSGDFTFDDTSGLVTNSKTCCECGCAIHNREGYEIDDYIFCCDCVVISDFSGEIGSPGTETESVLVQQTKYTVYEMWFEYEAENNAIFTEDEGYAIPDLVGETVDGDYYTIRWLESNGYEQNEDGEWEQPEDEEDE